MKSSNRKVSAFDNGRELIIAPASMSYVNVGPVERIFSVLGGALMGAVAAGNSGKGRKSRMASLLFMPVGMYLLKRGMTGYCAWNNLFDRNTAPIERIRSVGISEAVTVNKPRHEVYALWRDLENLPRWLSHVDEVRKLDRNRTHWTVVVPGGYGKLEWYAETIEEVENELISWKSIAGSEIDNTGEVRFRDAGDNATEILLRLEYIAPAGKVGEKIGKLFSPVFGKVLAADLKKFARQMELAQP